MPHLLPPVLSVSDLPEAELHAARLDSELFAVGDGFAPIDSVEQARLRGASLVAVLPPRLIAERGTAAWVLGARDDPPPVHEVCADAAARYRCLGRPRLVVREVVLEEGETTLCGGMRVTTARRTMVDIVRSAAVFGESEVAVIRRLAQIGAVDRDSCAADIQSRRHLPNKLRAVSRLRAALA